MRTVQLPRIGTWPAWRDAARGLLAEGVRPEDVLWRFGEDAADDLFGGAAEPVTASSNVTVPKGFVDLASRVVWHSDPERFARLYAFLLRVKRQPRLLSDRGDADLARLRAMEKNVNRCAHKMKAFVRFRDIGTGPGGRRAFVAWFEPSHHTVEPTAPFFTGRFGDMDWIIATPDVTARFQDGRVSFAEGQPRPDLPEDGAEALWGTYFRNIFNPARVKVQAMTSEMPKKYWKNLPEARHIPDLIAGAQARAEAMQAAMPALPPVRAERILDRLHATRSAMGWDELRARAEADSRDLPEGLGRIVLGEGPLDARLMIVGEQPGDHEDRQGRHFVGPAGQLFDDIAGQAGLDRRAAYVTNAVKQFKFRRDGKRRLHKPPNRTEIEHAKWWLEAELKLVKPALILSMGATALYSLTGRREGLLKRRGAVEDTPHGPVFVTVHPSFLLRLPDPVRRAEETARFREDLAAVGSRIF